MKKKAFKIASAIALSATLAAIEWNGYRPFDRADGGNALCDLTGGCRNLTGGEIAFARSIFGDKINYATVQVFARSYFRFPKTVTAPNGNLYIGNYYADDFSKGTPSQQDIFIHEMTHVAQFQQGTNLRWQAVREWFAKKFNYAAVYPYKLDEVKEFSALNLEQQAEMVEDFSRQRAVLQEKNCFEGHFRSAAGPKPLCGEIRKNLAILEKHLKPHFPLQPAQPMPRGLSEPPPPPPPPPARPPNLFFL